MDAPTRRRLHTCLYSRVGNQMCRWCCSTDIPSSIHIFCGLSGKVGSHFPGSFSHTYISFRALLATIKSLGRCPCPDCTTEMSQISGMGTKLDMKRRRDKARQDSEARQWGVNQARVRIYQFGHRVNGPQVERMLGPGSAVPNWVHPVAMPRTCIQ